jgi:hypothetical protein
MTQTHELKTWPQYFDAVARGEKNFEVRRDDRGFQKGDILELQRTHASYPYLVERDVRGCPLFVLHRRISYILTGGQLGIEAGYVVLGLEPESEATT